METKSILRIAVAAASGVAAPAMAHSGHGGWAGHIHAWGGEIAVVVGVAVVALLVAYFRRWQANTSGCGHRGTGHDK